jgi:uncharacterized protein (DUF58 family)
MKLVFSGKFYALLAAALVPLAFAWGMSALIYVVMAADILIVAAASADYFLSRNDHRELDLHRVFERRFSIGEAERVRILVENGGSRSFHLHIKDEYPPEMTLEGVRETDFVISPGGTAEFIYHVKPQRRGSYGFGKTAVRYLSRSGLVWCQVSLGEDQRVKVYPNMRRAREMELKALGARSFLAIQRRAVRRGEGREFESMRDYVLGDELRHISWTATARRNKLTTRQYQIERDQTVIIALDAGRLMTGRVGDETKFESALHSALALLSACARAGDNAGIVTFGRRVRKYLPPKRGVEHIDAVLEAFHDLEPELIEPSYARAFQFIASTTKKRAFIVILTDLVDKDSSKELINAIKLLRPRHLPLVATIGDRDLSAVVRSAPVDIKDVFTQSAAEEIIHQRESALRLVESVGGLALDVTAQTLAPKLLETYLKVKERAML